VQDTLAVSNRSAGHTSGQQLGCRTHCLSAVGVQDSMCQQSGCRTHLLTDFRCAKTQLPPEFRCARRTC